jgi:hypothetical protein
LISLNGPFDSNQMDGKTGKERGGAGIDKEPSGLAVHLISLNGPFDSNQMDGKTRWLFIDGNSSHKTAKKRTSRPITPLMELSDSEKQPG